MSLESPDLLVSVSCRYSVANVFPICLAFVPEFRDALSSVKVLPLKVAQFG
jgi:hypothetical protein